jgi:hypothetical protein
MNSSNWWANRLNGQPQAPPTYTPPPQTQLPGYLTPNPQYQSPQKIDPRHRELNDSAPSAGRCPGCGGDNYATVGAVATMTGSVPAMRCYDCGYPLTQSGSALTGIAPQGPTQRAHQIANTGWNPGTPGHIIGKLQ